MTDEPPEVLEGVITVAPEIGAMDALTRSEIDMQIATARRYPRNIHQVVDEITSMATIDEETAQACFYRLKRKGPDGDKLIEGPSIRMAEIALACYGNLRAMTRYAGETEDGKNVKVVGIVFDVQKNVAVAREVVRRITNRQGRRYSEDMIATTIGAAGAIALRNATFTVVPKAILKGAVEEARKTALQKTKSLTVRRQEVLDRLKGLSSLITSEKVLEYLGRTSVEEITWDDVETLIGAGSAIKNGETTVEEEFGGPVRPDVAMPKEKVTREEPADGSHQG